MTYQMIQLYESSCQSEHLFTIYMVMWLVKFRNWSYPYCLHICNLHGSYIVSVLSISRADMNNNMDVTYFHYWFVNISSGPPPCSSNSSIADTASLWAIQYKTHSPVVPLHIIKVAAAIIILLDIYEQYLLIRIMGY